MSERMTKQKDVVYTTSTLLLFEIRDLLEAQSKLLAKIDRGVRVGRKAEHAPVSASKETE